MAAAHGIKKLFASSSFYDDSEHSFPTIKEQLQLCQQVALSLTSPRNRGTRGSQMFDKRRYRAPKWTIENQPRSNMAAAAASDDGSHFSFRIPKMAAGVHEPEITRDGLPRCVVRPSVFSDRDGAFSVNMDEESTADPYKCFELSRKLKMASEGRGARMFAGKVADGERWVHDETSAPPPRRGAAAAVARPSEVKLGDLAGLDEYVPDLTGGGKVEWGETYNVVPKGWQAATPAAAAAAAAGAAGAGAPGTPPVSSPVAPPWGGQQQQQQQPFVPASERGPESDPLFGGPQQQQQQQQQPQRIQTQAKTPWNQPPQQQQYKKGRSEKIDIAEEVGEAVKPITKRWPPTPEPVDGAAEQQVSPAAAQIHVQAVHMQPGSHQVIQVQPTYQQQQQQPQAVSPGQWRPQASPQQAQPSPPSWRAQPSPPAAHEAAPWRPQPQQAPAPAAAPARQQPTTGGAPWRTQPQARGPQQQQQQAPWV
ncbi:PREDICTED: MICAL-like protein 2 isoform X2 [Priapulus caudatus]|uniref:MICAL-like protein 2 isoform X2 n=1 Tax=Priapulus caudatus TaxID=37621 RepID=A0ABM1EWI7_PRICU|nr:PREDICTED: MICAL-like protein 2 isoform X2 [Priapulus caudatus]